MRIEAVRGLMTRESCMALKALASEVDPAHVIVNIGVYKGQSAAWLASGTSSHVFAIDPWDLPGNEPGRFRYDLAEADARKQIAAAGLADQVHLVKAFSTEAAASWQGPVGLVFIDGDHSEKSVLEDAFAWRPHLAPGGIMVFDDLDTPRNPGVRKAVDYLVSIGWGPLEARGSNLGVLRP